LEAHLAPATKRSRRTQQDSLDARTREFRAQAKNEEAVIPTIDMT